jgi:receptor expression-enhancing protein 5/6
MTERIKDQLK